MFTISIYRVIRGFGRLLIPSELERLNGREKGYIYFQDFFDGNKFDIRVTVIGNKCLAARRYCRKNDFRASGSGIAEFSPELFDANLLRIAFETSEKLKLQAVAFDFILDGNNNPFLVEMSYGYSPKIYEVCTGYYDRNFNWHENKDVAQYFIIENFIRSIA